LALDRRSELIDLADVVGLEANDERPASRLFLDEPLGPQELEGLPDGAAAHVELPRDPGFDQVLARPEAAREDGLADPIRRVPSQGPRCFERCQPPVPVAVRCFVRHDLRDVHRRLPPREG
jgi:hypothetical protein